MAISFAAGAEYIQTAGNFAELDTATICLWIRPDSVSGNNRILGTDTAWEARFSGTTLLHEFRQNVQPTITTVFATGTWYHLAFTFDGTNKGAYVDGTADPAPAVLANGGTGTTNPLAVGSANWNLSQGMDGTLEDLRIYNRVLSQKEVQLIYEGNGQDNLLLGLQHWWTLNNGAEGSIVTLEPDLISKVNLSTVAGSPTYVKSPRSFVRGIQCL